MCKTLEQWSFPTARMSLVYRQLTYDGISIWRLPVPLYVWGSFWVLRLSLTVLNLHIGD